MLSSNRFFYISQCNISLNVWIIASKKGFFFVFFFFTLNANVFQEAKDGVSRSMSQDDPEARRKAAMHDPEVQAILNDPAMQLMLQQMQSQPEALRE